MSLLVQADESLGHRSIQEIRTFSKHLQSRYRGNYSILISERDSNNERDLQLVFRCCLFPRACDRIGDHYHEGGNLASSAGFVPRVPNANRSSLNESPS
jgi:hypothetical protein